MLFVFKKIFVFKNHSCSPLIASVIRVLINIREIRAIRVQKPFVFKNPFVFKKTFVFEIQKSSRHAAHHAEAAGDGREHGNDEIDDSFQGFLFHSFNFLMFTFFFVSFVFFFPSVPFSFSLKTSK